MSGYHRFGHVQNIKIKKGDKVFKGQILAEVGDGNGIYKGQAHLHYDNPKRELPLWTGYVFGMTKAQVKALYADPKSYRPKWYDHMGWGYLEYATYGTKKCYHPGEDWNGKGSGDADKGIKIESPCNGTVIYCYNGTGSNSGWGKLIVIKENEPKFEPTIIPEPPMAQEPTEPPKTSPEAPQSVTEPSAQAVPFWDRVLTWIISLIDKLWTK